MSRDAKQIIVLVLTLCLPLQAAAEFSGELATRIDYYLHAPQFSEQSQERLQPSLSFDLEWRENLGSALASGVSLFGRLNPNAEHVYYGDLQEAWLGYYGERSEWILGQLLEHWGVLEAQNIVDILNPRDAVEDFQGDAKLGVPGLRFGYLNEMLKLDLWLLTYAREQRLAEGEDRYRISSLPISEAEFEEGRHEPSIAARISTVQGNLEAAVSYFHGHSRDPWFKLQTDHYGRPTGLQPRYDLIDQTALELLWVEQQVIWKLEALYQQGQEDDFLAIGLGAEREVPSFWGTQASLTLYAEGYYDARDEDRHLPVAPFQCDLFLGARLNMNDVKSTEYQLRAIHDLEYDSTLLDIRASRRLNSDWSLQASLYGFFNTEKDPALSGFTDDHRIQLKILRNF